MKNEAVLYCKPANTETTHQLKADEFVDNKTFSCPPYDGCLWSSHPRVFLKLNENNQATCPYCGTHYTLGTGSQTGS